MSHHFKHPYTKRREYSNFSHHPGNYQDENPLEEQQTCQQEEQTAPPIPENVSESENNAENAQPEENQEEKIEKLLKDERLRMAAEMDNFKKRLTKEHQEQMRYAAERVLSDLLPALDNLDMAIQYGSNHEACADMMKGIEMTRSQLLDAVAKSGLVAFGETGEEFNPALHEAIGIETNHEIPQDHVSRIMQRGYKLNDRVLRPAKVMVNK